VKSPHTGKQVAIIGSGPSGLTAAWYLAILGHRITVFEASDQPGGMLRYGIPAYRLPKDILDQEIGVLKDIGVEISTGSRVDNIDSLFRKGFHSAYLAMGAQQGAMLGIPQENAPGVMDGISFLNRLNRERIAEMGDRVAVIGGGNSAIDVARSAVRLGAKEVTLFYRRTESEMPARNEEVQDAVSEGIKIKFLTTPLEIVSKNDLLEVTFIRMELGEPDADGRPRPVPLEGSEFLKEFENIIIAVGQVADVPAQMGPLVSQKTLIDVDCESLATARPGVYAGGDIVSGPATIIDAIAYGRHAATSIDKYLGGQGIIDLVLAVPEAEVVLPELSQQTKPRARMPVLDLNARRTSFKAVECGLDQSQAIEEASRCLDCDAREFAVTVFAENCRECGYCIQLCGVDVFELAVHSNSKGYRPAETKDTTKCVGCLQCYYVCPEFAIAVNEVNGKG
jgi:NADPH-dependent glutamate synthase beta subunit-like oxidoreductase